MKILAIGDPHGSKKVFDIKIPKDVDAIFITGDIGNSDLVRKYFFEYSIKKGIKQWKDAVSKKELKRIYLEIINSSYEILKYFSSKKPTFFVLGNLREVRSENIDEVEKRYGLVLPRFEEKIKKIKGLVDLSFNFSEFKGLNIAGIPFFESAEWIKEFSPKNKKLIENAKREEPVAKKFIKSLKKVDILLTHIPPCGILDKVESDHVPKDWLGKHAGNKLILNYIKKKNPSIVLCGHIHEGKGREKVNKTEVYNLGFSGDYEIIEV